MLKKLNITAGGSDCALTHDEGNSAANEANAGEDQPLPSTRTRGRGLLCRLTSSGWPGDGQAPTHTARWCALTTSASSDARNTVPAGAAQEHEGLCREQRHREQHEPGPQGDVVIAGLARARDGAGGR